KRRYPQSELVLLDVDAFAVESSRRTLAANGLEAEVIAGDGIDAAPRQLTAIVSNPPFHHGVHTSYQASVTLLQRASEHLVNGAEGEWIAGHGIDAAARQRTAIVSNPPFHQGVHTSYQASETLIERASEHLVSGGELRLVANAFLRYPPLIEQHLGACQTI